MVTQNVTFNRQNYLGGSDIAAVMGLSRWKTPLKLWAEKTLRLPAPDLSGVEAVQLGSDLEEFVAAQFTKATGKTVRRAPKGYTHPEYDYMVAHVDRLVTGTDELLECKTCSAYKEAEWQNEEIPQEYILQVMWYLGITGRKKGYIACLIGGQKFVYKEILFDSALFDQMVDAAKDFWQHVQNNTAPTVMPQDDSTLQDLYSTNNGVMIELFPTDERSAEAVMDLESSIAKLQETKMHIKNLDEEKTEIETKIKDLIKDNLGICTPKYTVTWKTQRKSQVDARALCENEPNIYAKYEKVSSYRVMRISKNKESEVA